MIRKNEQSAIADAGSDIFAGRQNELVLLSDILQHVRKGKGHTAVIRGEQGTGKHTLIQRFADGILNCNMTFVSTRFTSKHAYKPYAPFAQILTQIKSDNDRDMLTNAGDESGGGRYEADGSARSALRYVIQQEHNIAQQQLLSAILNAAKGKVLCIELRDCHSAPLTAWRFIHYLAESVPQHSILLLVSLRKESDDMLFSETPAYADVLQRMNREGLYEKIELAKFSSEETGSFLNQRFRHNNFSHQFINWMNEQSDGNPAQLVKGTDLSVEQGIIYQGGDLWLHREDYENNPVLMPQSGADSLTDAMAAVDALSEELRNCLDHASLMQSAIDYRVLANVLGTSKIQVLKHFSSLTEKGILIQNSDDSYQFKHSALRSLLAEQIPPEQQSALHAEFAAVIEALDKLDASDKIYLLAFHYSKSDNIQAAIEYLLKAGETAVEHYAFLEAMTFLNDALTLSEAHPALTEKSETIELLFWVAWIDRILGNWQHSIEQYARCRKLCDTGDLKLKAQILLQEGLTYFRLADWQKACNCIEECLANESILTPFDKAMAFGGLGNIYFERADYEKSSEYYQKAIELGKEIEAQPLIANLYNNLGAIENIRGHRMRAIALYSKSVPIFKNLSDGLGLARVYNNIGMTYADDNQYQQADEFYGQSLQVSDVMGLVPMKAITFLNRAAALLNLGQYDEAREYNSKALHLVTRLQDELGLAEYHKNQGIIEHQTGNYEMAEKLFKTALQKFKDLENPLGRAETEYELGRLAQTISDESQALKWFNASFANYQKIGNDEKIQIIEDILRGGDGEVIQVEQDVHSQK